MRFFLTYRAEDQGPPKPEQMAEIGKFSEEMKRAGILLDTGGLLPSSTGARLRAANGKMTVTDGPFPETKEMIVGWAMIQVRSKEEAIEIAKRFMKVAGEGEGEVIQMMEGPP